MNKRLLFVLLTLLFISNSYAQIQQDPWIWPDEHLEGSLSPKIGLGPKIGSGFAMATSPSFFDFQFKGGFAYQLGLAANVSFMNDQSLNPRGIERVGLEIEVLFSGQNLNAGEEKLSMKRLEIPIMVQFYATSNLIVEAGVTPVKLIKISPDYLQSGNIAANVGGMRGNDMMLSAGACYKTPFGLDIALRYNHGTSKMAENFHSKIRSVTVSASYLFPIIK